MRSTVALWMACAAVALAVVPAAWVLLRETLRRAWTKRAMRLIARARQLVGEAESGVDPAVLARSLTEHFDRLTVERAVIELLRSEDPRTRPLASRLFTELGLVDRYIRLLGHSPRWSERAHAAEVLGLAGASNAIPALVAALRDRHEDETSVKAAVAASLAKLRDATAIPLLVKELQHVDDRSSHHVAEALVAFGPIAAPALVELLADPIRGPARVWAARILGRIGDAGAVDQLMARLHDRDDRLRMTAAEALGAIGDPRALHAIVRATLRDPASQVRAHAAGAIARIQGERAVEVLVAALDDPDFATRVRALEAFETMRVEDVSPLESALRDPNPEVRRRAALALERVGYLDRIVGQLASEDRAVRARVYASLLEIGQAGLVESIAAYLHHASFEVRAVTARACGELGAKRVAPVLLQAIDDEAWPVRAAVCEALGRLSPDEASAPLMRALGDREEPVTEAAAEALTNFSPQQLTSHTEALAQAYDRGSVAVRRSVVIMAGRIGGPVAQSLVVRASIDPSDAVRLSAVAALGQRGAFAAESALPGSSAPNDPRIDPLVARLTDASIDVRMAAVTALGSIDRVEAFDGLLRALPGAPPPVRDRIAEALARGAKALLFERLPELERNRSLDVRLGVAWTLGKIGSVLGVATLARFLRDFDSVLRASAAGALAKIAHASARDALLEGVEDPDGRVRAAVVNALGRTRERDDRVLGALELRARDPDPFVRNRAIIALSRAGGAHVETRVRALADRCEPAARLIALALVGTDAALASVFDALAAPRGLETTLVFLDREDEAVRAAFFAALRLEDPARSGHVADAAQLLSQYERTLRTSLDVDARRLAVAAVERIGLERALPVLADAATGDPSESVRVRAAAALSPFTSDDVARRALVRAIADPNPDVAIVAVRAVAKQREAQVTAALERRLGSGEEKVQEVVEAALADRYREDPTPFVDWMMGVDVPDQLTPAVRVLARMTSPATLPLLRQLLRSGSMAVRSAAVRAVASLDLEEVGEALDEAAQDPNEDVRVAVVDSIRWSANSLTRFARLRRDPSVRVRTQLATALERTQASNAKSAHKALEGMLSDASASVRAAALASLAASSDGEGLRVFVRAWSQATMETRLALQREPRAHAISDGFAARLLSSGDPVERKNSIIAIGAFGVLDFTSQVLQALKDPSADVRVAAIQTLALADDAAVRARIAEMLHDPELVVQEAARRSLIHTVG